MNIEDLFGESERPVITPRLLINNAMLEAKACKLGDDETIDLIEKRLCQFMERYNQAIAPNESEYRLDFIQN